VIEIVATGAVGADGADALVVGVRPGPRIDVAADWVADTLGPGVSDYLEGIEFEAKTGQVAVVQAPPAAGYRAVVFAGLGEEPDAESVRRAAGAAGRATKKHPRVATTLHRAEVNGAVGATAMGFALGQYGFERHRSSPSPAPTESLALIEAEDGDLEEAGRALVVARGVVLARDLVNEPAVFKSPQAMAGIAEEIGSRAPVTVRIYDEDEIAEAGFGGLMGVNAGAANPPRMVEFRYEPEEASAFVAFVGKGIVFDSGGLSLKPAAAMETMKTDMSGAAAVFGAVEAIATLGLPIRVLGITPLTENMPGGSAIRPGDVLTARNGKTIEVLNTDAEGRLVLADGLSLAVEETPDLIVDLATLTGACMVALGEKIAGVMGTDDAVETVTAAAEHAGERTWRLPLPADYRANIDSDVADMKNSGPRYGGAIHAALLLQEFAGEGPWAHLDIAGPARAKEAEHYIAKGGTGFGVRTLVAIAERLAGG
jgi:leucyl aminopeptidase